MDVLNYNRLRENNIVQNYWRFSTTTIHLPTPIVAAPTPSLPQLKPTPAVEAPMTSISSTAAVETPKPKDKTPPIPDQSDTSSVLGNGSNNAFPTRIDDTP